MNNQKPVLVFGGTRGTGLLIVRLLQSKGFRVRVLARNAAQTSRLFNGAVEIVAGDLTKPDTLPSAIKGTCNIVFTAGCRSGLPVSERQIKAVEYQGMVNTLTAMRAAEFSGRLLYMNSSGLNTPSLFAKLLNLWKGNTLHWRRRVEQEIRTSGVDYTIIRAGVLLNAPGGCHSIHITQQALPLSFRYRIARADVAQVFVATLENPHLSGTTFEAVWGSKGPQTPLRELLYGLCPDGPAPD